MKEKSVYPGFARDLITKHFSQSELNILEHISKELYVTNSSSTEGIGQTSSYNYCIVKPTDSFKELFTLRKEIIVLFSDYDTFETRSLDAIDRIAQKLEGNRLDKLCTILISKDVNIKSKIEKEFKSNPEFKILIPFSYGEFTGAPVKDRMLERFRESLFSRDLFERSLDEDTSLMVIIDCSNPDFNQKRWYAALRYLLEEFKNANNLSIKLRDEESYTQDKAAANFEKDIIKIHKRIRLKTRKRVYGEMEEVIKERKIFFVFDEIEHITFDTSVSPHWKDGSDFILFWQSLRSIYQKTTNVFTYAVVGTNPRCIEKPTINGVDNPIFSNFSFKYIPGFNFEQTQEMITKLGGRVGILFDSNVISSIAENFGGHPFLMRQFCSMIYQMVKSKQRPYRIDKTIYDKAFKKFRRSNHKYINMVLEVLQNFYNTEYEMLEYLAKNEIETFKELANLSNEFIEHLIGYGIIDQNQGEYFFKIDLIEEYLKDKYKYQSKLSSAEEMWEEVSERSSKLEILLRKVIGKTFFIQHGEVKASIKFLSTLGEPRQSDYAGVKYTDLIKGENVIIKFKDLVKMIDSNYEDFKNIFGEKDEIILNLSVINQYRVDANTKEITQDEMNYFRNCIKKLENKINTYFMI